MSYDHWKTTDPRNYDPRRWTATLPDDDYTEVDRLADRCAQLEGNSKDAAARIQTLEGLLGECLTYLEKHYDVVDGKDGQPAPNEAMRLGNEIRWVTLGAGR